MDVRTRSGAYPGYEYIHPMVAPYEISRSESLDVKDAQVIAIWINPPLPNKVLSALHDQLMTTLGADPDKFMLIQLPPNADIAALKESDMNRLGWYRK